MCPSQDDIYYRLVINLPHYYAYFQENKFLKELIISNNRFGEIGGEILGPAIGRSTLCNNVVVTLCYNMSENDNREVNVSLTGIVYRWSVRLCEFGSLIVEACMCAVCWIT